MSADYYVVFLEKFFFAIRWLIGGCSQRCSCLLEINLLHHYRLFQQFILILNTQI